MAAGLLSVTVVVTPLAAPTCKEPLVDSLADAKLVWATRGMMPNCYPEGNRSLWQSRQGGQAGPVVADGRVYIWFYELNATITVPEPSTLVLLSCLLGCVGLFARRRRMCRP